MTYLLAAEQLKLRTTRVPYVLAAMVVLLSAIAAAGYVGTNSLDDDPWLSLAQGASFANVVATILGILIVTNEYRHGTITSTFLAEPARERVLAAKLVVGLLAGVALAVVAAIAALAVAVPWQAARGESLPVDGTAVESFARLAVLYALACGLGVGVGAIVQNQVGAIVATFVWFFVAETIISIVSSLLGDGIEEEGGPLTPYLPGSALQAIVGFEPADDVFLGAGWGTLLACGYVAGLALLGGLAMLRRDP